MLTITDYGFDLRQRKDGNTSPMLLCIATLADSPLQVVTGAKSEDDSKLASRKYARIIQKLGFNAKFTVRTLSVVLA